MMDALTHWLLTYIIHSTLLLGAVVLVQRALGDRWLAFQEALLRAALIGGFATAGLQQTLHLHPLAGSLALPHARLEGDAPMGDADFVVSIAPRAEPPRGSSVAAVGIGASRSHNLPAPNGQPAFWKTIARGIPVLLILWSGLALFGLMRLALAAFRLRRLLRDRRPLRHGEIGPAIREVANVLGFRNAVRLSVAPRLTVPVATGLLRSEVCLPMRVLAHLVEEEQVALCAHEMAHLARRDPAWLLVARLVEILAPVQPLNRWARLRLADLAECLSDDLAVSASAKPLGLARSLVDVAAWTLAAPAVIPATAAGAFGARSRLAYRVERLMNPVRDLERPRRGFLPLAGIAILATALVTPIVSGSADDETGKTQTKPETVAARPAATPQPAPLPAVAPKPAAAPQPAPAPPAAPLPPVPPSVTHAGSDPERQLERLEQGIGRRIQEHEGELAEMEFEIEAMVSRFEPEQLEIERLSEEIERISTELADTVTERFEQERDASKRHPATAASARRIAQLERQLQERVGRIRIPQAEMHALQEKARAIAESARPTAEEMAEIKRLSEQLAHDASAHAEEIARAAHEAVRQAHQEMRHAHEQARHAHEQARHAREQALHAHELAHPAHEEAHKASRDALRTEAESRESAEQEKEEKRQE